MRITMIGTGYVGLVSGVCFSDFGHNVICIDKDVDKIKKLCNCEIPIFEPGLEILVNENVTAKRLTFQVNAQQAVQDSDIIFIAVGTPARRGDGHADLTYVYAAAKEIAEFIKKFTLIVIKSTVPVGTGDAVEAIIRETNPDADFAVVSNPEFLREGSAIEDFKRPDRVVIGLEDDRARPLMSELYRPLYLNETPIVFTNRRTSEIIKYAANAFLATKITFINELADLCELAGADVQMVAKGIGLDKRIGSKFLNAGPGYGGSCFPKDTLALVKTADDYKVTLQIIQSVIDVNSSRKKSMGARVMRNMTKPLKDQVVAILGLAFKPNTDDMRDAPSIDIITNLMKEGIEVRAYDPEAMQEAQKVLSGPIWCQDPYEAMNGASVMVIVTEWDQFRALDINRAKSLMITPVIIDLRNIYDPDIIRSHGFNYHCIGEGRSKSNL